MPFSLTAKPPKPKPKKDKEKVVVRSSGRGGSGNIKRKTRPKTPTQSPPPAPLQTSTRTNEGSQSNTDVNAGDLASTASIVSIAGSTGDSSARHPTSAISTTGNVTGAGSMYGYAPSLNSLNRIPTSATANTATSSVKTGNTGNTGHSGKTGSAGSTSIPDAGEVEDQIKAPMGREILSAKHRKLYSGRGGAGNAHKLLADDKIYERVLLHEQGIVQSYKEERKAKEGRSTGRGGAGNIKKKKSGLGSSSSSVRTGSSSGRSWGSIMTRRNRYNSSTSAFESTLGTNTLNTIETAGTIEPFGLTSIANTIASPSPISSIQPLPSNGLGSPMSSAVLERRVFERLDEVRESDDEDTRSVSSLGLENSGARPSTAVNVGRTPMQYAPASAPTSVDVNAVNTASVGIGLGGGSSTMVSNGHSSHSTVPDSTTINSKSYPDQRYSPQLKSELQPPPIRQPAARPIAPSALASGSWIANGLQEPASYSRSRHYNSSPTPSGSSGNGSVHPAPAMRMEKTTALPLSPFGGSNSLSSSPFTSIEGGINIPPSNRGSGMSLLNPNSNQRRHNEVIDISISPSTTPVAGSGMTKRSGSAIASNETSHTPPSNNPTNIVRSDDRDVQHRPRPREALVAANASNRVAVYGSENGHTGSYGPGTDYDIHRAYSPSNDDPMALYAAYTADPSYMTRLPYLRSSQSTAPPSPSLSSHSHASGSGSRASSRQAQQLTYITGPRPLPSRPPPPSFPPPDSTPTTPTQKPISISSLGKQPLGPAEIRHSHQMSGSSTSEFGDDLDLSKYNFPDTPGHRPIHARNERDMHMPSLHMVVEAASPAESMMSSRRVPASASSESYYSPSRSPPPSHFRSDFVPQGHPPPASYSPPQSQSNHMSPRALVQPGAYQPFLRSDVEDVPLPDAPPPLYQPRASRRYPIDPTLRYDRYEQDSEYSHDFSDGHDLGYSSYSESTLPTPTSYSPRRVASPSVRPSPSGGHIRLDQYGYGRPHHQLRVTGAASPLSEAYTPIEDSPLERLTPPQESRNEKERYASERDTASQNEKHVNHRPPQSRTYTTRHAVDPYQRVLETPGTGSITKPPPKTSSPAPIKSGSSSYVNSPEYTAPSLPPNLSYAERFPAPESSMSSSHQAEQPDDDPLKESKDGVARPRNRPMSQVYSTYTRSTRYSTWDASQATATAIDHHDHDFPPNKEIGTTANDPNEEDGRLEEGVEENLDPNDAEDDDGTHFYTAILAELDATAVPSPNLTLFGERARMKETDTSGASSHNMRSAPSRGGNLSPREPSWLQPGFQSPPIPQIPKHLQANFNSDSNRMSPNSNSKNLLDLPINNAHYLGNRQTSDPSGSSNRQLPVSSGNNSDSVRRDISSDRPTPPASRQNVGSDEDSCFPGGMGWDELNRPAPRKLSRMEKALLRRVEFGAVAAADIASIPLA